MGMTAILAALVSGGVIGLILGLVGGGGSILAVPLLIYVVGVGSPHAAIGTAAVAVTVNALAGLVGHARAGRIKWRCAAVFAIAGMVGAALGAELGKAFDGKRLLILFGMLMIGVGLSMLRARRTADAPDVRLTRNSAAVLLPRLIPIGLGVGLAAGFFGIGGGFLIVPGLVLATAMPLRSAIGTSLVVVSALGLTTATSYAASGLVDWGVTALLVAGGVAGTIAGNALGRKLGNHKGLLEWGFAGVVIAVGGYVVASSI
ncbi:sulfite exporter TauE/SafE family protein [Sphingomonas sanxanigenens]|uniref:Probable membrane transporter protein n=1 Tax=Sphingomonas sanxanigenens DSM 19645 = NX02 TaxID=1123269 RepID=W0A8P5_9SPHN|nr:sulfite exporter TauE/SafE family protein [Sphingomonas sanxanigenens]AHE52708.1 membrane protein [Sphingomonas sanxanigenens DSM 19645 = NX02]